mmetsp:Transcript_7619/g.8325  ORF Transcript_7619/g.8325 Transcript_7619/m.8325 type:complete len:135 (-) Transcript_7619:33-437(-)
MAGKTRRSAKVSKLSAEEKAKYKEIAEAVSAKKKDKTVDAKAAVEKIQASMAKFAEAAKHANDGEADKLDPSDPEFVGIVLCGEVVSGGELKIDLDDVYVEEPREEEEKEEEEKEDERSLWGDGDDDPAEAGED